jgi:hypothetical protein
MSSWMTRPAKVQTQVRILPVVMVLALVMAALEFGNPRERGWAIGLLLLEPFLLGRLLWLRAQVRKDGGAAVQREQQQAADRGVWRGSLGPWLIGAGVTLVWVVASLPFTLPSHSPTLVTLVGGFGGLVSGGLTTAAIRRHGGV